ncbi:MAG: protein pufQ [Rhodobacteraceae bacterium]|nr:protein pufQ [Paracoccaceae bacterium]
MSDHTAGGHDHHVHRTPRAEFYIYFALIFAVAIPLATFAWVWVLITEQRLPVHGPLARAWREAGAITPAIFRP